MKFTQKQIILVAGGIIILVAAFYLLTIGIRPSSSTQKVTLTVWGTDPKNIFTDLGNAYKVVNPNATINYVQLDPTTYDSKLLQAFAAGTGPDLFEIDNRALPKWLSVAAPIPATLATTFTLGTLRADFPQAVEQDFAPGGQVYALPLDFDTLALFYNKDLFDSANIVYPPKTWDDFQADVLKLRVENSAGQITKAAAALGGSGATIANAPDIVFLMMLQNGTTMISSDGSSAMFDNGGQSGAGDPGLSAFNFYLQFANSASPYYTWNDGMGDAVQNFTAGDAAMIFGYGADLPTIKNKAPFLNFGVAPVPQPASSTILVNYPKYEGLAVSRAGQSSLAWQFAIFAATDPNGSMIYSKDTGLLPATLGSIQANLNDPNYGVFASQALSARSWWEANEEQIDGIMNSAIVSVLNGSADSSQALGIAANSVTTVMEGR
jgi:ABC-type glycerol-3-phosphate transport system substrate-binding protein